MNQRERAEKFLEGLAELSKTYGFAVVTEGADTLLSDEIEGGWIAFGTTFTLNKYKIYED